MRFMTTFKVFITFSLSVDKIARSINLDFCAAFKVQEMQGLEFILTRFLFFKPLEFFLAAITASIFFFNFIIALSLSNK